MQQQHVIVFEGPDRTGKSEISTELSKRLGIPRFKNHREKMFFERDPDYFVHALRYGDPYFAAYLKQSGASIILDRSFPSEWVYSRALERHTDHDMLRMVDTMYAELGTKIVLARRSSYEGIIDDEFRVLDSKMLQRVDELYAEFSEWTSCQTLTLLVDDEDLEREIEAVTLFTLGPKEERNACKGQ